MNKNPTMKNASENLSKCLNPKKNKDEIYWEKQDEISKFIGELRK